MTKEYELTWRRNTATGDYTATDEQDGALYAVSRLASQPNGQQWMLSVIPAGLPVQFRHGFDTMASAKAAALSTRCHLCGRHRPFGTLTGDDGIKGWRCRDTGDCERIQAEKEAAARRIAVEIRSTPMDEILVQDAEGGPELVFRHDYGHGQKHAEVVRCTEEDLDRLLALLMKRRQDRILTAFAAHIHRHDEPLDDHDGEAG